MKLTNAADAVTLHIYEPIGAAFQGVDAKAVSKALEDAKGKKVTCYINSPGGDFFDGLSIASAIQRHGNVECIVDGVAASAASIIACAAKTCTMMPSSSMMVHSVRGIVAGTAKDLRTRADLMAKQSEVLANIYAKRTGQTPAAIQALFDKGDTWMNAEEAVAGKFADRIAETAKPVKAVAPNKRATNALFDRLAAFTQDQVLSDLRALAAKNKK